MRAFLVALAVVVSAAAIAQTETRAWIRTNVAAVGAYKLVAVDRSGNVFAGTNIPHPGTNSLLAKYNSAGVVSWQKYLEGRDEADMKTDAAGNVIVAGTTFEGGSFLEKISPAGNQLWRVTAQFQSWSSIVIDSSGGVTATGNTGAKLRTTHFNAAGAQIWSRDYIYPISGIATAGQTVRQDGAGNIYVLSVSKTASGPIWSVIKYSKTGHQIYIRHVRGFVPDGGEHWVQMNLSDIGFVLAALVPAPGVGAGAILRTTAYEANGEPLTSADYPVGRDAVDVTGVAQLSDGSYLVSGRTWNTETSTYIPSPLLVRTSFVTATRLPAGGSTVESAVTGPNGEFYYGGSDLPFSSSSMVGTVFGVLEDYFVIHPAFSWQEKIFGSSASPHGQSAFVRAMQLDANGDLVVVGGANLATQGDGFVPSSGFVAKYSLHPLAVDDDYNVTAGQALSVEGPGVVGNDRQTLASSLGLAQAPAHGTLTLNANGSFIYNPDSGFTGDDTAFYFLTKDGFTSLAPIRFHVQ